MFEVWNMFSHSYVWQRCLFYLSLSGAAVMLIYFLYSQYPLFVVS